MDKKNILLLFLVTLSIISVGISCVNATSNTTNKVISSSSTAFDDGNPYSENNHLEAYGGGTGFSITRNKGKIVDHYRITDHNSIRTWDQVSVDDNYDYQYSKIVQVSKTKKEPVYGYKKEYRTTWKHYKTKWYKTKVKTHKFKKGKVVVYNNRIKKVVDLVIKKGRIIKTVYTKNGRTVYLKYPVYYYKKVKKCIGSYMYIKKYRNVVEKDWEEQWINARGSPSSFATFNFRKEY